MEHLSEVAVKEKVNADDAALNIIAQKADGSMRDALSIFDQVVSFSGQNVDYHTVVANLNVLDYEYYFVLTDAFLIGNYQSSLITYNDILNKGFDSHNFINGLGSHFRNLLVSRDAETIQLMELSGEIADKYLLGAKKCTVDWLFKGLSIINACDISYKQAKDPRLHIEIALLKLANLSGHVQSSATPAIVPEKLPEKSAVEKKAPISESVGEKVVHGNSVSSIDNEDDNKDDNENENSAVDTVEKPKSSEPAATYAKAPIDNGLKTGTRISDFLKKNNPSDDSNSESEKPIEDSPVELLDCTNEQILVLWKEFAESIKIEQPRLFNTLTSQLPELQDNMVLVHSNNPLQLKALKSIHFEIEGFLKQKTGNDKLQLQHEMKDHPGGEKKLYTQEDKYRHLQQKNPDLDLFKQTFKLDHE
ncbi:MAG: hypothetical protein HOG34_12000 [Bacteroidetes bacterium]|nr:hypothetical protein [Bacteroidota bacterium]